MGFFLFILFIVGIIALAVKGDEWFLSKYNTTYICNYEGEVIDMYEDKSRPKIQRSYSDDDIFDDDDDDDYNRVVYIDEDEVDSFGSLYEESAAKGSSEPMLYGGLPFGDGQIYFEDDGDGYL